MAPTLFPLSDLRESFDDDKDIIISIVDMFLEEVPQDYSKLKEHVQSRDFTAAGMMAHKLKSSYRTLGINDMAKILEEMESRCKNAENLHEMPILLNEFNKNYENVNEKLAFTKEKF